MVTQPNSIALYKQGCVALEAGAHAEAARFFADALAIEPGSFQARFNLGCALQVVGDMDGAIAAYRICADRHPESSDGIYNLACALQAVGDVPGAIDAFRLCVKHHPDNMEAGFNIAACLQSIGDVAGAISAYRACVLAQPDRREAASNLAALLYGEKRYREALTLFVRLRQRFPDDERIAENYALTKWQVWRTDGGYVPGRDLPRILVACMPKSGSTFLTDVLAKLPGMIRAHLVPDYGRREQELDLDQLVNYQGHRYVCQLHLRPNHATIELMQTFGIRPLFLYRNLWDVMASLRDHLMRHSLDWSMALVEPAFRDWDVARQYIFIAQTMMPWFIDFYVGWARIPDKLTVSYEALMADPSGTVARIAQWAGIAATAQEVVDALAATGQAATFNQGGSGRGKSVPEAARAEIRVLTSFYPDVDFAPLLGEAG